MAVIVVAAGVAAPWAAASVFFIVWATVTMRCILLVLVYHRTRGFFFLWVRSFLRVFVGAV